ncbi:rhombosortase [Rhodopirellula halodulae]|uniref:rhombosortase n=1 Tax=Rhodopirellula halodulae TaxID=2894198 RepID=UPI001E3476BE|nr:rhombosortase [Rhodopirellula sp. JC737]MCC9654513.1 rhombosortase [Rhodopirellula sp. JC737]
MSAGQTLSQTRSGSNGTPMLSVCQREASERWRSPLTMILATIAIAAFAVPDFASFLQLDYVACRSGQWWRLMTGHLAHFGLGHLFWDLLMFVVLGAACERRHSKLFPIAVAAMALVISGTLLICRQDVTSYRGLSGIDTGLFAWFVLDQIRLAFSNRDRSSATIWSIGGCLLVGKLCYELFTGEILFVDANGFTPLVESHVCGAVVGATFAGLAGLSFRPQGRT